MSLIHVVIVFSWNERKQRNVQRNRDFSKGSKKLKAHVPEMLLNLVEGLTSRIK